MSFVTVVPDSVSQAAGQLGAIGSALKEAHATAAAPTTGIVAAAKDEVSVAIAAVMNRSAEEFQALTAQAATFHNQFVGLLNAGAGAYVGTEAANVQAFTRHATSAASTVETPPEALQSEVSSSVSSDEQIMAEMMAQIEKIASGSALSAEQKAALALAQFEQQQQAALLLKQQANLAAQAAYIRAATAIAAGVVTDVGKASGALGALHAPPLPEPVFVPNTKIPGL